MILVDLISKTKVTKFAVLPSHGRSVDVVLGLDITGFPMNSDTPPTTHAQCILSDHFQGVSRT